MVTKRIPAVLVVLTAVLGFTAGVLIAQGRKTLAAANAGLLLLAWFVFAGIAAWERTNETETRKESK